MKTENVCECPKQVIGQGWFAGVWRDGIAVATSHRDTCPKFEDYSTGDLSWLQEAAEANAF